MLCAWPAYWTSGSTACVDGDLHPVPQPELGEDADM